MATKIQGSWVLVRLHETNPRKPGTQGYAAWDLIVPGMTVDAYVKAVKDAKVGKIDPREHVLWDRAHGWLRFDHETADEAKARAPKGAPAPKAPTVTAFDAAIAETLAANAAEAEAEAATLAAAVDARLAEAEVAKPLTKAERKAAARAAAVAA